MCKNNDYTTGNLLDYEHFPKQYKLIAIDLSKQTELQNHDLKQKISLMVTLKMMKQQCFSSLKIQSKQLLNFTKFCEYDIKWKHKRL